MRHFLLPYAEVSTLNASGVFRVTIQHKYPVILLVAEAIALSGAIFWGWDRSILSTGGPAIAAAIIVCNLIVLGYRVTASEIVEFDERQLAVSRTNLGCQRTSGYPLPRCSKLQWRRGSGNRPGKFRCKFGWRTITFGKYLDQEQADRLVAELQAALPNVAQRLFGNFDPSQRHLDPLKLR